MRLPLSPVVVPQRNPPVMLPLFVCQHSRSLGYAPLEVSQFDRCTPSPTRKNPHELDVW
jgi:hypothetical protein